MKTEADVNERLKEYAGSVNQALDESLRETDRAYNPVIQAMRYSLLSGGKRLRATLLLEFCRLCGGNVRAAMPFACALEMIHTYSLIHDDLPCMDNDDLRRGLPTCHKVYGETLAVLAGDGLLTYAFAHMAIRGGEAGLPPDRVIAAIGEMASSAGVHGMVGGQTMDMQEEGQHPDEERLTELQSLKTGALIAAACRIGCILAGAPQEKIDAAGRFAGYLGLAFQIRDDMLDVVGDEKTFGKPVGSDQESGKATFVSAFGLEKCGERIAELSEKAIKALEPFEDTGFLEGLIRILAKREK